MDADDVLESMGLGAADQAEAERAAIRIQAFVRGRRARRMMEQHKHAAISIQKRVRGNLARSQSSPPPQHAARKALEGGGASLQRTKSLVGTSRMPPSAERLEKQKKIATNVVGSIVGAAKRLRLTLEELFVRLDEDGSGDFDVIEFRRGMLSMEVSFTDAEVDALMSQLDSDGGGTLTLDEFVPRLLSFQQQRGNDANTVLSKICHYLNIHGETAAAVFSRLDTDGGGSLDLDEFHQALNSLGIEITHEAASEVMDELDMDGGGDLELKELTAKLDAYRRGRRAFAARVLGGVLEYTERTKTSVTRVFASVDTDGSGDLDIVEFQEAMRSMGQVLTHLEIQEVMAELDIDGSGTIEASEFLDKLKQFAKERATDVSRCKELFAEIDEDDSGHLDEKEVKQLAKKMGFEEQMKADKDFVAKMIQMIEQPHLSQGLSLGGQMARTTSSSPVPPPPEEDGTDEADGDISCDELIRWYLDTGKYYLKKPEFKSKRVEKPTPAQRETLFTEIDVDGSGELDLEEVQNAVAQLWPTMPPQHTQRAFETADEDGGGLVSLEEFKKLLGFIVWFNEKRHQIEELEQNFGEDIDGEKFYFACTCLGEPMSDEAAVENFDRLCNQTGHSAEEGVPFNTFLGWLARRHYVDDEPASTEPEEQVELLEDADELNAKLAGYTGDFGDVHMQDLASVLGGRNSMKKVQSKALSSGMTKLKNAARRTVECSSLIREALRFATENNNCFPTFEDNQLRQLASLMRKEEFFANQHIITQGEDDANYYVLRRGKVEVHIKGPGVVGTLEWGMGFGEVALVLGTKRTATIRCITPCEVYKLTRAQYESEVAAMDEETRSGDLQKLIGQFWALCTGPDGSRRPEVDFSVYLKLHIRVSKTLTEDEEDYDEDEERDCARTDWSEDMERYGLQMTDSQDQGTFVSSMYQLVDLWAEDRQISYGTFMQWLFENIAVWDDRQNGGEGAWVFAKMGRVECIGQKFNNMKAEAVSLHEKFVGEEVTAAADAARAAHEEEQARLAEERRLAEIAEQERLEKERLAAEEAEKRRKLEEKARKKAEAKAAADKAAADKQAAREAAKLERENRRNGNSNGAGGAGGAGGTGGGGGDENGKGGTGGGGGDGNGQGDDGWGNSGWDGTEGADGGPGGDGAGVGSDGNGNGNGRGDGYGRGRGDGRDGRDDRDGPDGRGGRGRRDGRDGDGSGDGDGGRRGGRGGRGGRGDGSDADGKGGRFGDGGAVGRHGTGRNGGDGSGSSQDDGRDSDGTGMGRNGGGYGGDGRSGRRTGGDADGSLGGGRNGGDGLGGDGQHGDGGDNGRGQGKSGRYGHGAADSQSDRGDGTGSDGTGDVGGAGTGGATSGSVGGLHGAGRKNSNNGVSFGGDSTDGKGYGESMYTAQLGSSELLNNTLRPLKPSRELLEKRAREQREAGRQAAELRAESPEMFSGRSFKKVQALTRWPIQPLWPVDTNGAMHPIEKPDAAVRRGFRPATDGRPSSMCGVKSLFEDEILLMGTHTSWQDLTRGEYEPLPHRAMLKTPGGVHVNAVTLDGADSTLLRCTVEELNNTLLDRDSPTLSISPDGGDTTTAAAAAAAAAEGLINVAQPRRGTLEPLVNRGVKVSPNQKCSPSVRRPGTREKSRVRTFSKRLGNGHGQFRNWRVSGAFGPREVEKLTMINIDRDPALAEDELAKVGGSFGPDGRMLPPFDLAAPGREPPRSGTGGRAARRLRARSSGGSKGGGGRGPMRASSSAGEVESLSSSGASLILFANRAISAADLSGLKGGDRDSSSAKVDAGGIHRVNSADW